MPRKRKTNPVMSATARLGGASRRDRPQDPEKVAEARNALVAAKLERAIEQALRPADREYEPLRQADRDRLAAVLKGAPV